MIDNHVHIGWYSDGYHCPLDVWKAELDAGIDDIVVSSTSTCAELYKLVVREMRALIKIGGPQIHPLLWVTPRMMKTWGIRYMLHSKIRWQGIKMHWGAHREWFYNDKLVQDVLKLARTNRLPILLHTGGAKECDAIVFKRLCNENDDITFVLAHGRPIDQAIEVLKSCSNSYVDTAFMPQTSINRLVEERLCDRVIFGTDVPINTVLNNVENSSEYIKNCLNQLSEALNHNQFITVTNRIVYQ